MTCKDCKKHKSCETQNRLMLTICNDICELVYQNHVERSCTEFVARGDKDEL